MTISKNEYLICPCKVSSIPYWKSKSITVPDGMCIVHKDNFNKTEYQDGICQGGSLQKLQIVQ